jgi:hypothetical protein
MLAPSRKERQGFEEKQFSLRSLRPWRDEVF